MSESSHSGSKCQINSIDRIRGQPAAQHDELTIDPVRLQMIEQRLAAEQNLGLGVAAGMVAAGIEAAVWAAITFFTGYQIGWMAIGVGLLVGYAVSVYGKGLSNLYGIAAALLALAGCALGNVLAICAGVAAAEELPLMDVISQLAPSLIVELLQDWFSPIDLLFYGFAIYQAYVVAFRYLNEEKVKQLLTEDPTLGSAPYN